jgi:hypothetical protein
MLFSYEIHYEYDHEDEDRAWAHFGLMRLMGLFQVGVYNSDIHVRHSGDITISIHYRYVR